ncbi:hypothetical protein NBRC3222_1518 [Acetobacter pasteurianus NBRC 3222]|nr:hypothetical protein NBRC3222_1518 [Acetobacter pasteurianus NBRC 3222]
MVLRDASGNFVAGRSSCLQTHNLKAAGSNPAPATTSIIIPYKSTADRHETLAHQTVTRVPTFERGPGDHARLRIAMAYRATSTGFSDPFRTKLGNQ